MMKNRKIIISIAIILVFLLILLIGYGIITISNRAGKTNVMIIAVPSDSSLTLNDKPISTGTQYVTPGTYTLKASKSGYESTSTPYTITQNTPNQAMTASLVPISEDAKKEAEKNQEKYLELESIAGTAANDAGEAFRDKNPIVSELPFSNLLYTIGYKNDPDDKSKNSVIVVIDAPSAYRQAALYQIQQWGYDLSSLKIEFRNYTNPFDPNKEDTQDTDVFTDTSNDNPGPTDTRIGGEE